MYTGIFTFNGESSSHYNLYGVKRSTGFNQSTLIGGATIEERDVPFDYKPMFQRVKRVPYDIPLRLLLIDESENPKNWTPEIAEEIISWLIHKEYKPLIFDKNPNTIFYVLCTNAIDLSTVLDKGCIDVTFRTNSPYGFREAKTVVIDATSTPKTGTIIGDKSMAETTYPIVDIERTGNTNGILNIYKQGEESDYIRFHNLEGVSNIRIYTKQRIIKDINTGDYLYHFRNPLSGDKWIELINGENKISLSQGWKATLSYQEAVY